MSDKEEMNVLVDSMNVRIADLLSKGIQPTVLIGADRTIVLLLDFYCGGQPDWREQKVMLDLDGEGKTVLRILRTIDLPLGELIIL